MWVERVERWSFARKRPGSMAVVFAGPILLGGCEAIRDLSQDTRKLIEVATPAVEQLAMGGDEMRQYWRENEQIIGTLSDNITVFSSEISRTAAAMGDAAQSMNQVATRLGEQTAELSEQATLLRLDLAEVACATSDFAQSWQRQHVRKDLEELAKDLFDHPKWAVILSSFRGLLFQERAAASSRLGTATIATGLVSAQSTTEGPLAAPASSPAPANGCLEAMLMGMLAEVRQLPQDIDRVLQTRTNDLSERIYRIASSPWAVLLYILIAARMLASVVLTLARARSGSARRNEFAGQLVLARGQVAPTPAAPAPQRHSRWLPWIFTLQTAVLIALTIVLVTSSGCSRPRTNVSVRVVSEECQPPRQLPAAPRRSAKADEPRVTELIAQRPLRWRRVENRNAQVILNQDQIYHVIRAEARDGLGADTLSRAEVSVHKEPVNRCGDTRTVIAMEAIRSRPFHAVTAEARARVLATIPAGKSIVVEVQAIAPQAGLSRRQSAAVNDFAERTLHISTDKRFDLVDSSDAEQTGRDIYFRFAARDAKQKQMVPPYAPTSKSPPDNSTVVLVNAEKQRWQLSGDGAKAIISLENWSSDKLVTNLDLNGFVVLDVDREDDLFSSTNSEAQNKRWTQWMTAWKEHDNNDNLAPYEREGSMLLTVTPRRGTVEEGDLVRAKLATANRRQLALGR